MTTLHGIGIGEGCILLLSQRQFDKQHLFFPVQEPDTKVIPGMNIKYYGTVEVR